VTKREALRRLQQDVLEHVQQHLAVHEFNAMDAPHLRRTEEQTARALVSRALRSLKRDGLIVRDAKTGEWRPCR
jgi:hypothetical protein